MWRQVLGAVLAVGLVRTPAVGQTQTGSNDKPNFSGSWTLDRDLSDNPRQSGSESAVSGQGQHPSQRGGYGGYGRGGGYGGMGRGGYGGYGGSGRPGQVSPDDQKKIEELGREAKSPSPTLTISHSTANIAISDAQGHTRFFQTNGSKDQHQLDSGIVTSTTKWDGNRLVMDYDLGSGRKLTYTYSIVPATRQLLVQVRFDNGQGQTRSGGPQITKYVYDPAPARRGKD
jgi:hypothetical protein